MESSLPSRIATAMQKRTDQEVDILLIDSRAWLYRLALAIVAQPDLAEDLAQETLLRATASRWKLRLVDDPKAWLRQILVRRAITALGARKSTTLAEHEAQTGDPTAVLAVRSTLNRLPAIDRAMLALWHFEGLSYEEMATALQIPAGTVASRLNSAREAFRKEWAK